MGQDEIEGLAFFVDIVYLALHGRWQEREQLLKAFMFVKSLDIGKKMRKNFGWLFHVVIITLLLAISGCGYKADPYYEPQKVQR